MYWSERLTERKGLYVTLDTWGLFAHWRTLMCIKTTQGGITLYPLNSVCPSPMPLPLCSCLDDQICNLFHNASGSHTFSFGSPLPCNLLFSLLIGSRYCQLTDAGPVAYSFQNQCLAQLEWCSAGPTTLTKFALNTNTDWEYAAVRCHSQMSHRNRPVTYLFYFSYTSALSSLYFPWIGRNTVFFCHCTADYIDGAERATRFIANLLGVTSGLCTRRRLP